MKNKFKQLESKSGIQGLYECRVMEPPMLPGLRRVAYRRAGFHKDYDGSYRSCVTLPKFEREMHDVELTALVKQYGHLLNSPESRHRCKQIRSTGKKKNLILDQGINNLFAGTANWSTFSTACAVGTGTTPVVTDSGATTATTAGSSTTVTASGSFFTAGMVGMLFNADDGQNGYIASQTGTACVLGTAINLAAPTLFAVWAVNQVGLASESKRTITYLTGAGNCGTTDVLAVRSSKRTYDFTAEVSNQNYTELGWSHNGSAGNNLNSRTLITGGTVSVLIGQQLRTIYTLEITVAPATSTPGLWSVTNWPVAPSTLVDGDYIATNPFSSAMTGSDTSGGTTGTGRFPFDSFNSLASSSLSLATGTTLPSFGTAFTLGTSAAATSSALVSYTLNSFTRVAQYTFNLATGNATNWRAIAPSSMAFVFDQVQTKANTHTLRIDVRATVSRPLTNP